MITNGLLGTKAPLGRWHGIARVDRNGFESIERIDVEVEVADNGSIALRDLSREALDPSPVLMKSDGVRLTGRWLRRGSSPADVTLTPEGDNLHFSLDGIGMTGLERLDALLSSQTTAPNGPRLGVAKTQLDADIAQYIMENENGDRDRFMTTSLLVQRGGERLAEQYFWGQGPANAHIISSCTKSILGLLAGIAFGDHGIDPDSPAVEYIRSDLGGGSWSSSGITLRNMLNMASGTEWDGDSDTSDSLELLASEDIERFMLEHNAIHPRGSVYRYDNGLPALLGILVQRITGENLDVYAQRVLFDPIDIPHVWWSQTKRDGPLAAGGMYMRPRDMVRLGELVLAGGMWNGRQVVPSAWISESAHSQTPADQYPYSYYWHLSTTGRRHLDGPDAMLALGQGGQMIAVIPELDAVITATSRNWGLKEHAALPFEVVNHVILPALKSMG